MKKNKIIIMIVLIAVVGYMIMQGLKQRRTSKLLNQNILATSSPQSVYNDTNKAVKTLDTINAGIQTAGTLIEMLRNDGGGSQMKDDPEYSPFKGFGKSGIKFK